MSSLYTVAVLTAMLQQTPVAAVEEPSQQLLVAAVKHMNAQRLDSAALLLRRVADSPTRAASDRVRAFVLLGVVDYYRSGDSASAVALRQALVLDPGLQVPALDSTHPDVARILAAQRAAVAPSVAAAPPAVDTQPASSAEAPALLDCLTKCAPGGRPPHFTQFPDMQFRDGNAGIGVYERRLRSFLTFQAVIGADGIVEPETVQVTGGAARGMETDIRRALAQSRFAPGRLNDVPVRTRVTLRFDFESEGTSWLKYSYKVTAR